MSNRWSGFWTGEKVERLKALVDEGHSYSVIGMQLGVTRNSAIGKAMRMGLDNGAQFQHLIAKPSMCGFGLDWSHCARMAFVGRSYSYETYYQAVRRCWRFGQKRQVVVDLIVAEGEDTIGRAIDRKAGDHTKMKDAMRAAMVRASDGARQTKIAYEPNYRGRLPSWLN